MSTTMVQDGMTIDWDVDVPLDDGAVLKGDVFRPISGEPSPVLLTYGPYAKGLPARLSQRMAADDRQPSGCRIRFDEQISELGSRRS
jgi:predicted acyl esterase